MKDGVVCVQGDSQNQQNFSSNQRVKICLIFIKSFTFTADEEELLERLQQILLNKRAASKNSVENSEGSMYKRLIADLNGLFDSSSSNHRAESNGITKFFSA